MSSFIEVWLRSLVVFVQVFSELARHQLTSHILRCQHQVSVRPIYRRRLQQIAGTRSFALGIAHLYEFEIVGLNAHLQFQDLAFDVTEA